VIEYRKQILVRTVTHAALVENLADARTPPGFREWTPMREPIIVALVLALVGCGTTAPEPPPMTDANIAANCARLPQADSWCPAWFAEIRRQLQAQGCLDLAGARRWGANEAQCEAFISHSSPLYDKLLAWAELHQAEIKRLPEVVGSSLGERE
jgi:hypothetical protein